MKGKRQGTPLDVSQARELGRQASIQGRHPEDNPYGDYPGRQCRVAWLEGYHEAQPAPPVVVQRVELVTQGTFWPREKPFPSHYMKIVAQPCPACFLHRLPSGGQAVITSSTTATVARLRCQSCGHQFKLPVKEAL